jgi:hypothetical protein
MYHIDLFCDALQQFTVDNNPDKANIAIFEVITKPIPEPSEQKERIDDFAAGVTAGSFPLVFYAEESGSRIWRSLQAGTSRCMFFAGVTRSSGSAQQIVGSLRSVQGDGGG